MTMFWKLNLQAQGTVDLRPCSTLLPKPIVGRVYLTNILQILSGAVDTRMWIKLWTLGLFLNGLKKVSDQGNDKPILTISHLCKLSVIL